MKILHLLYPGLGGTGNVFFSMVKAGEKQPFDCEAIFAGIEDIREEYVKKCEAYKIRWVYIKKKIGIDIPFSRELFSALKASRAPVIFLHGSRFIVLAKIAALLSNNKKKIIVAETQANQLKTNTEWIWLILTMLFADQIVFLTEQFDQEIRRKLAFLYRSQKISVINNGIDLAVFKPATKLPAKTIVLGMQSRIIPIKDHATLLQAFSQLQIEHPELALQLKIAGDGSTLSAMEELARQLQINGQVQFAGLLDETELVVFLQSLDIYIHASLGETMSTAIMQAMACKLPIIASDVPGINNMITNEITGILVPSQNKTALANAVYSLITDCQKAKSLKEAAFKVAQLHYSNTTMFAKYKAIFEKINPA